MTLSAAQIAHDLDNSSPADREAQTGHTLADLIAAYNDLRTQYVALLTRLDGANVAGGGNVAAVSPTLNPLAALGSRSRR